MTIQSVDWERLRFGVEIEFVGGAPEKVELLPGWVMSLDERQIDDDGELSGSELKPPPIVWEDRDQIRLMLSRLHATGARINWNCGLHVHVSLEPWGLAGIPHFLETALQVQDALQALLDTSRDRLVFCPPVTKEMLDLYLAMPCQASLNRKGRPQSHRCGINLAAAYDNGTVEIRFANGSLDYAEICDTIQLCLRFVAAVGAGQQLSNDPVRLAAKLGAKPVGSYPPPIPAPRWYRERIQLEDLLVPILAPIAGSLVENGEILHILPVKEGVMAQIEDGDGRLFRYLFQPPAAGWVSAGELMD